MRLHLLLPACACLLIPGCLEKEKQDTEALATIEKLQDDRAQDQSNPTERVLVACRPGPRRSRIRRPMDSRSHLTECHRARAGHSLVAALALPSHHHLS